MSRFTERKGTITVAYGYDPVPMGGYFFQVFDEEKKTEENEEGIILNEGFVGGISKNRMVELMTQYGVNKKKIELVALDLPI